MNLISHIASDVSVQLMLLAMIGLVAAFWLIAHMHKVNARQSLIKARTEHEALMELRRFERQVSAIDGKVLLPGQPPHEGSSGVKP